MIFANLNCSDFPILDHHPSETCIIHAPVTANVISDGGLKGHCSNGHVIFFNIAPGVILFYFYFYEKNRWKKVDLLIEPSVLKMITERVAARLSITLSLFLLFDNYLRLILFLKKLA